VRRDLRLRDNPALAEALRSGNGVVPLFIFDPALQSSSQASHRRLAFLCAGLRVLDEELRARGARLIVRHGAPDVVLAKVMRETGAVAVVAQQDVSPYGRRRDEGVAARMPLRLVDGLTALPLGRVRRADGRPYTVFTFFRRAWESALAAEHLAVLAPPNHIQVPGDVATAQIPTPAGRYGDFRPGEHEAYRRLVAFTTGADAPIYRYAALRDRVDLEGTAGLSPYLRFGMLSAREAVLAALAAARATDDAARREGARRWLSELVWREFYMALLHHFPRGPRHRSSPAMRDVRWEHDEAAFAAWATGCTGVPIVDAAMRQLAETGWMHNRVRMIAASFLVKDLLLDWRRGERHFMQHLLDGDPAANSGNWRWTAGVGVGASPYFRIFNPARQGRRADPRGEFVRRWVPELSRVPVEYVHEPWRMPVEVQRAARCRIGEDYPRPIVDHEQARSRALARYKEARGRGAATE